MLVALCTEPWGNKKGSRGEPFEPRQSCANGLKPARQLLMPPAGRHLCVCASSGALRQPAGRGLRASCPTYQAGRGCPWHHARSMPKRLSAPPARGAAARCGCGGLSPPPRVDIPAVQVYGVRGRMPAWTYHRRYERPAAADCIRNIPPSTVLLVRRTIATILQLLIPSLERPVVEPGLLTERCASKPPLLHLP